MMKIDLFTKTVLGVVAVALSVIAIGQIDWHPINPAFAASHRLKQLECFVDKMEDAHSDKAAIILMQYCNKKHGS